MPVIEEGPGFTDMPILDPCLAFSPDHVRANLKLIAKSGPQFYWTQCEEATVKASKMLAQALASQHLTDPDADSVVYRVVWGSANSELGEPLGHVWLEAAVCGRTFLTDMIGGDAAGASLGFSAFWFAEKTEVPIDSPYNRAPNSVYESANPVDNENAGFKAAQTKAYNALGEQKKKFHREIGIEEEPWWVPVQKWLASLSN